MCHLALALLVIEAVHKAVVVQDMNKPTSWTRPRVWNTHVDDYSHRWWYSIEYFTRSSACERPAVAESFICRWVGLKGSYGQVKVIAIGGFERRYDSNCIKMDL
jgi:hypothetical protein